MNICEAIDRGAVTGEVIGLSKAVNIVYDACEEIRENEFFSHEEKMAVGYFTEKVLGIIVEKIKEVH